MNINVRNVIQIIKNNLCAEAAEIKTLKYKIKNDMRAKCYGYISRYCLKLKGLQYQFRHKHIAYCSVMRKRIDSIEQHVGVNNMPNQLLYMEYFNEYSNMIEGARRNHDINSELLNTNQKPQSIDIIVSESPAPTTNGDISACCVPIDNNIQPRMYVIVRKDLSAVYKMVQGAHALAQFSIDYPTTFSERWNNQYLIFLEVQDGLSLLDFYNGVDKVNIQCSKFIELDLQSPLPTAIALYENGTGYVSQMLQYLKLAQ